MKELVRGCKTMEEVLEVAYLDDENDELSNYIALKTLIYAQEDWDIRIRFFEPLRAKATLDSLAEKQVYTCKLGPIAEKEHDNEEFFSHTGRFIFPRGARVLKKEQNILADKVIYHILTGSGEKRTIVL